MSGNDGKAGLGQLRHMYRLLCDGRIGDQRRAADGLLAPGIRYAEQIAEECARLRETLRRHEQALRHYADEANWYSDRGGPRTHWSPWDDDQGLPADGPELARRALGLTKEES